MPLGKVTELKLECLPESEHTPPTASNGQDAASSGCAPVC